MTLGAALHGALVQHGPAALHRALALAHDDDRGPAWVSQLTVMSARSGMRELVARSHWYRGRLGEPGASEGARQLATQIRNPVLDALVLREA